MFKSYQIIMLFLAVLVLLSCKKEMDTFTPDPITGSLDKGQVVQARVSGTVYNLQAEPIAGAIVTIGQDIVYTDNNGVFLLDQANVSSRLGHITIEKQGYFKVPKSFTLGENQDIQIHTVLMDRNQSGSFNAISGGPVTQDGLNLEFPSGAIVTDNGQPYEGNVKVYAAVIDPDHEYFSMMMPGMLFGERLDGSGVSLATSGMIAVELESASGQPLQVAEGSTVKTTMPIPASLLNDAPAEIPTWSIKKDAPYWKEEAIAHKEGSAYVADLSHFSFWGFCIPFPAAKVSFQLVDENNNVLPYQHVRVTVSRGWYSSYFSSDRAGRVSGIVIASDKLEVFIKHACGSYLKVFDIDPLAVASENDLGIVSVQIPDYPSLSINGSVLGCDGYPKTSAYALIKYTLENGKFLIPHNIAFTNETGDFQSNIIPCNETGSLEITGFDPTDLLASEKTNIEFDISENLLISAGPRFLCQEPDEFIEVLFDGAKVVFLDDIDAKFRTTITANTISAEQSTIHGPPHKLWMILTIEGTPLVNDLIINQPYNVNSIGSLVVILDSGLSLYGSDPSGTMTFTEVITEGEVMVRGVFEGTAGRSSQRIPLRFSFKLKV